MKTLISEYAGIVIAVLVVLGILSVILLSSGEGAGVLGIAGEVIQVQTRDVLQEQIQEQFDNFLQQGSVEISYVEGTPIYAGEVVNVEEHFSATDAKGSDIPFEVVEVYDGTGNSCSKQVMIEPGKMQFAAPGIYQVLIQTTGENCKNVSGVIAFPVKNQRSS